MNKTITQEEFEKYVNKLVEKLCCNDDDTIDIWEYIKYHYYPEKDIDDFYGTMTFSVSKHEEISPIIKIVPMYVIMGYLIWTSKISCDYSYSTYLTIKQNMSFLIAHSEASIEVFGSDSDINSISDNFALSGNIFFNPQKEVLEGDLEHKDKVEFKLSYLESALKWLSQKQNHGLKMN